MMRIGKGCKLVLIFIAIIRIAYSDLGYSQTTLLRPAIKFNNLELLHRIYSQVEKNLKKHLDVLSKKYEGGIIPTYLPLPTVSFLTTDKTNRYEYNRVKNEIVFYVREDIEEGNFRKICWLAYGDWLSQNEAAEYNGEGYNNSAWNSPYINYVKRKKKYINPNEIRDKNILDVATGVGIPGIILAESGAGKVTCLDVSSIMLELAKEEADKRKLDNIFFKQGSIFKLPFNDNSFDMVFFHLFLERSPEELRRVALSEILRVLKPGGKLKFMERYNVSQPALNITGLGWDNEDWLYELKEAKFEKTSILYKEKFYYDDYPSVLKSVFYIIEAHKPQNNTQTKLALEEGATKETARQYAKEIVADLQNKLGKRLKGVVFFSGIQPFKGDKDYTKDIDLLIIVDDGTEIPKDLPYLDSSDLIVISVSEVIELLEGKGNRWGERNDTFRLIILGGGETLHGREFILLLNRSLATDTIAEELLSLKAIRNDI
ncbi:class I SAM-dependent methyltransferase [Candidatus Omnitrophota bacterium]